MRSLLCLFLWLGTLAGCSPETESTYFFVDHVERSQKNFDEERFRSYRKEGALTAQITLDGDTRRALVPPVLSKLAFEIDVPADPVMRFSIGASTMGAARLASSVEFYLTIDDQVVFAETVRRARPNQWFDRVADLSSWAGSRVELTFETRGDARAASVLPLWGNPVLASSTTPPDPAKLILISVDCLRSSHVGVYGYERDTTPRLDALAADGVVFETTVSTSSYTHPTHMSMLTGLPPAIHGATRTRRLSEEVAFLPELLAEAGYRTDGVVSGAFLSQNFGFERGFHTYRYIQDPGAGKLVDEALDVLSRGEGQRQFLFFHLFDPHLPYVPPAEFRMRFGPRPPDISHLNHKVLRRIPPSSEEEIRHVIDLYDGEIAYLDQELGRFFDELAARGLYDQSLIIVTADHGEAFYEHGHWEHAQTLYEEMVRIPLIVKWPKSSPIAAGSAIETQVSQTDIFPTLLEQAGLESPGVWAVGLERHLEDGVKKSLRTAVIPPRTAVIEVTWDPLPTRGATMQVALRRQSSKYIATVTAPTTDALFEGEIVDEELYDLSVDPNEKDNVISRAERAARRSYREELRAYLAEGHRLRSQRRGETVILDEAIRENLEALGYIER